MDLDPLAIRNLLIWIALAVLATILLGAVPSWIRCAAKRADPSAATALFAFVLAGACVGLLFLEGKVEKIMQITQTQALWLALCGLLSALVWLSLFTALTGGLASKVVPIYLLWYLLNTVASHFLFGAPLGLWKICCIILVLLGVVFIESRTQRLKNQLWFVYAFLAALAAVGLQLLKQGVLTQAFDDTVFHAGRAAFACVILWIFVFVRKKHLTLASFTLRAWVGIFFAALFLAGSYAATYFAARYGEMSTLAPIEVLTIFFAMLFARMFQKEKQPGSAIFGTLLVMLGQFGILMGL